MGSFVKAVKDRHGVGWRGLVAWGCISLQSYSFRKTGSLLRGCLLTITKASVLIWTHVKFHLNSFGLSQ